MAKSVSLMRFWVALPAPGTLYCPALFGPSEEREHPSVNLPKRLWITLPLLSVPLLIWAAITTMTVTGDPPRVGEVCGTASADGQYVLMRIGIFDGKTACSATNEPVTLNPNLPESVVNEIPATNAKSRTNIDADLAEASMMADYIRRFNRNLLIPPPEPTVTPFPTPTATPYPGPVRVGYGSKNGPGPADYPGAADDRRYCARYGTLHIHDPQGGSAWQCPDEEWASSQADRDWFVEQGYVVAHNLRPHHHDGSGGLSDHGGQPHTHPEPRCWYERVVSYHPQYSNQTTFIEHCN